MGCVCLKLGQMQQALYHYNKTLDINPDHAVRRYVLYMFDLYIFMTLRIVVPVLYDFNECM